MNKRIKNEDVGLNLGNEKKVVDIISLSNLLIPDDDFFNDFTDDINLSFNFSKEDLEFFRLEGLE